MGDLLGPIKNAIGFGGMPDAYSLIMNLGNHIEPVRILIYAIAYMLSLWITFFAIRKLAVHGEGQNSETTIGGIVVMFASAIILFYLPTTLDSMSFTVFGDAGNALAYTAPEQASQKVANAMAVIYRFIGLAGLIAVVHGILVIKAVAEGTTRDNYSKGVWHLIGGWCAIHLDDLMNVLKASAGFN